MQLWHGTAEQNPQMHSTPCRCTPLGCAEILAQPLRRQVELHPRAMVENSRGIRSLGSVGLRSGSDSAANVANVPGGSSAPSTACRPELDSPICTNCRAGAARFSTVASGRRDLLAEAWAPVSATCSLALNSGMQSPLANNSRRSSNRLFGIRPPRGGLCNDVRGNSRDAFQARNWRRTSRANLAALISSIRTLNPPRNAPCMNLDRLHHQRTAVELMTNVDSVHALQPVQEQPPWKPWQRKSYSKKFLRHLDLLQRFPSKTTG